MTNISTLIDNYLAVVTQLKSAVADMSHEQLIARPIVGKWSTLELVCHIADFELVLVDRMKRIIAMDRPLLLVADEDRFTETLGYQERDLEEELKLIEVTRSQMARILRLLPLETFQRSGVHSFRGLVTLEATLTMATNHIPHHLKFLHEKRAALGLPVLAN
ncbi:DinB family protein [Tuwongella immobilis]|uniref:DinB-like domain-containing protein n=1 Tax=Tuwongella immobilis TaxID=692036 RepID=A0A6C2YS37_9BACT|nr:DinB family protein [Tuwongella immobilis]VIP04164.1 Hypothetical conserved protein OS=uncultured planctomycete GN=HGMM_F07G10C13 PE=4 SV=1: DinB_2 [Tuwongella immobilis]VTS05693.1 Hypothetical conserved protein OS=uncultured planctomycete GN=HGMM_F07G10C13 PE=4 SV=1: DinB_2 [Tuwongella immobilis]